MGKFKGIFGPGLIMITLHLSEFVNISPGWCSSVHTNCNRLEFFVYLDGVMITVNFRVLDGRVVSIAYQSAIAGNLANGNLFHD